jgi:hypothetical protein
VNNTVRYILRRLGETSTWRGLIGLLTLAGVSLSPALSEAIIGAGVALYLLIEALLPDAPAADKIEAEEQRAIAAADIIIEDYTDTFMNRDKN